MNTVFCHQLTAGSQQVLLAADPEVAAAAAVLAGAAVAVAAGDDMGARQSYSLPPHHYHHSLGLPTTERNQHDQQFKLPSESASRHLSDIPIILILVVVRDFSLLYTGDFLTVVVFGGKDKVLTALQ